MSVQRLQGAILKHLKDVHQAIQGLGASTWNLQLEKDQVWRWNQRLGQEVRKGDPVRIRACMDLETDLHSLRVRNEVKSYPDSREYYFALLHAVKQVQRLLPQLLDHLEQV